MFEIKIIEKSKMYDNYHVLLFIQIAILIMKYFKCNITVINMIYQPVWGSVRRYSVEL